MSKEELEINGTPPCLDGKVCEELLCEQYWHNGTLCEPVNLVYLRCDSRWHRLTFDCGIVFWREQADLPESYAMPELNAEAVIENLGEHLRLQGQRILSYTSQVIAGGSEVAFHFEGGKILVFQNVADHTTWHQ